MLGATNKADGIAYSWHDMPVEFSSPKGNLKNYYSANGTKLKTVVEPAGGGDVSTTHYFTGIEYKDEELHTAYWSEGRANFAEGEPQHEYYLKDHLGNTRVRFTDKKDPETGEPDGIITYDPSDPENDEVLSTHQYYPFDDRLIIATAIKKVIRNHFLRREPKTLLRVGGWDVPNVDSNGNSLLPTDGETRYTYNGKEFQSELGLDLHYYGFRVYDPAIGRFTSVDPIAEQFAFVSGFNYAENRPINGIDLHGLQFVDAKKATIYFHNGGASLKRSNLTNNTNFRMRTARVVSGRTSSGAPTLGTSFPSQVGSFNFDSGSSLEKRRPASNGGVVTEVSSRNPRGGNSHQNTVWATAMKARGLTPGSTTVAPVPAGKGGRGAGIAWAVSNELNLGANLSVNYDLNKANSQFAEYGQQVLDIVGQGVADGTIPASMQNGMMLGDIANYVFQGEFVNTYNDATFQLMRDVSQTLIENSGVTLKCDKCQQNQD